MSLVVANPGRDMSFLAAFDESLRKLNNINDVIRVNTENKRNFTGFVLTKLRELHDKIKLIVVKIKDIKQKIALLQGQVNQNNSGVQAKDAELTNLKQQLDVLTAERNDLKTQLDQLGNDAAAKENGLQTQINDLETQLRVSTARIAELETEKATLETQLNALRVEIQNNGDAQTQAHQAQLQQLADQHRAEIQQLNDQIAANQNTIAANEQRIKELTDQHGAKDTDMQALINENGALKNENEALRKELTDLKARLDRVQNDWEELTKNYDEANQKLADGAAAYKELEDEIEKNKQKITELEAVIIAKDQEILRCQGDYGNAANVLKDKDTEIANLKIKIVEITRERDELQKFNADLEGRIRAATDAITLIAANLEELTNQRFYDESMSDVTKQITDIERTLGEINIEIDDSLNQIGVPPSGGPPSGGPQPRGPLPPPPPSQPAPKLNLRDVRIYGYDLPNFITALKTKSSQQSDKINNKYLKCARDIEDFLSRLDKNKATINDVKKEIDRLLYQNIINFASNGTLLGGYKNKTKRKSKKQGKFTRKQKGGFVYGKFKNTSNKSKNTSKTNSTTSSLSSTSSYNTFKKNKKPKSKDFSKRKRI